MQKCPLFFKITQKGLLRTMNQRIDSRNIINYNQASFYVTEAEAGHIQIPLYFIRKI